MESTIEKQPSKQFEAFENRVKANLHVPLLSRKAQQFWIERPHLIPYALAIGFATRVADDETHARKTIEKFIWATPVGMERWAILERLRFKKLIIWFMRQSKGFTEEIILYSPFDPDDQTPETVSFAKNASYFAGRLQSSDAPIADLDVICRGVGCPLCLASGTKEDVARFYFTFSSYDGRKARRIKWTDAMEGMKGIEEVKSE